MLRAIGAIVVFYLLGFLLSALLLIPSASLLTRGATPAELAEFLLSAGVARWQVPESWTFVAEIPKTAVGKFDKKVLRTKDAAGDLPIERI